MNIRHIYQRAVPLAIRRLGWLVKNEVSYVFSNRLPARLDLDYEGYWERREAEDQLQLSYTEITELCVGIIASGSKVLDVGCGNGAFLRQLKQRKNVKELGIDISSKAIALARAEGINAKVVDVLREDIKTLGEYDYVTAFEVLEHLPNPEVLLSVVRALGKQILVTIPNTGYYLYRLRLLFGRFPRQWIQHPAEHLRFWTLTDFQLTAKLSGYEIAVVLPVGGRKTLAQANPNWFAESLLFVLKPKRFERPPG